MDDEGIRRYVAETFAGVEVVIATGAAGSPAISWGDTFFFYDPDDLEAARRFPFATIVTKDYYHAYRYQNCLFTPGILDWPTACL